MEQIMQNKYNKLLFVSPEKDLLIKTKKEFVSLYNLFSDSGDFSVPCTLQKIKDNDQVPPALKKEFADVCEQIRQDLLTQISARRFSMTKIENLMARIRFIKLRFMIN